MTYAVRVLHEARKEVERIPRPWVPKIVRRPAVIRQIGKVMR